MTALSRRTRRQYALTPPFVDDDESYDLLYRTKLPRIPIPTDDEAVIEGAAIPALTRPPLSLVAPPAAPPVEFGAPYGSIPTLARPPLHDIDRIAALGEANPLPTSESDIPLLSRTPQMPATRSRPQVYKDESNHPSFVYGGDSDEQRLGVKRRALEQYEPQKESKKSLALRTILGFVGGGIPGAVGTLIGPAGVLDRRGKDRAWQQQQLGQVYGQLDRTRADRRAGLQDDLLESQVMENKAQAQRAMQPPTVPPLKREGFNLGRGQSRIEINPVTGKYESVFSVPDREPQSKQEKATDDETPGQLRARQGQFRAAQKKFNDLIEEEKRAAQRKDAAYAKASTLRDWYNNPSSKAEYDEKGNLVRPAVVGRAPVGQEPFEEDVKAAEKAADDAQRYYESLAGKKSEAEAAMLQYGDVDDKGGPRAPQAKFGGLNPIEQRIYDAAAKNPKLDPNEAVKRYREGKRAGKF